MHCKQGKGDESAITGGRTLLAVVSLLDSGGFSQFPIADGNSEFRMLPVVWQIL
ncbi:MAG: hypothetical protein P4K80_06625 [Acidobacteriaceae bacterium]|nr:hypothetical protein [Acidobacteriaceae bacterium]